MPLPPIEDIRESLSDIQDPEKDPAAFDAMLVIVSSMGVGTNPHALAAYTKLDSRKVIRMVDNLKDNQIFNDDSILVDPFESADSLMMYANVALGISYYDPLSGRFSLTDLGVADIKDRLRAAGIDPMNVEEAAAYLRSKVGG